MLVTAPRRGVYRIHVGGEPETEWERADARARAEEAAVTGAKKAAVSAGTTDFTCRAAVMSAVSRPEIEQGSNKSSSWVHHAEAGSKGVAPLI